MLHDPAQFQRALDRARLSGARVGFVPTMGALHAGHLALVREARSRVGPAGVTAVSIFVNPTQFGPNEDFARYPRQLDADVAKLGEVETSLVFAPEPEKMYPSGEQTRVRVERLTEPLCGPFRPGHFDGVTTVVAKLFALTGPCVAVFGRKDYQQLQVIRRMATDLFFDVQVVGLITVRESRRLGHEFAQSGILAPLSAREPGRSLARCPARSMRGTAGIAMLAPFARAWSNSFDRTSTRSTTSTFGIQTPWSCTRPV